MLSVNNEIEAAKKLSFKGTAYIAGHGGHLTVIDLNTIKPPTDIEKGRIVVTEKNLC
ncbi:MAG: hypothetical protein ACPL7I_06330 [Myxococcota bacterium]